MQADPRDPGTWPGKPKFDLGERFNTKHATNLGGELTGAGFRPGTLDADAVRLTDLPSVRALAQQLGGGNVSATFPFDGHLIPRFPEPDWEEPVSSTVVTRCTSARVIFALAAGWYAFRCVRPKRLDWRLQPRLWYNRLFI